MYFTLPFHFPHSTLKITILTLNRTQIPFNTWPYLEAEGHFWSLYDLAQVLCKSWGLWWISRWATHECVIGCSSRPQCHIRNGIGLSRRRRGVKRFFPRWTSWMRVICLENLLLRFLHKVFKILQGHKKNHIVNFYRFFWVFPFVEIWFFMLTLKKIYLKKMP